MLAGYFAIGPMILGLIAIACVVGGIYLIATSRRTVTLTMDRYTHTVVSEQAEALKGLPDLDASDDSPMRSRKTGTDAFQPGAPEGALHGVTDRPLLPPNGGETADRDSGHRVQEKALTTPIGTSRQRESSDGPAGLAHWPSW